MSVMETESIEEESSTPPKAVAARRL